MTTIYVVRHGQAHFGSDDYDRLTDTGFEQARLLGQYWRGLGLSVMHVVMGTMRRHRETAQSILEGLNAGSSQQAIELDVALNEYNPVAVIEAHLGHVPAFTTQAKDRDPESVRAHFRILRDALMAWANGDIHPAGMPSWADFQGGVVQVVQRIALAYPEGNVLIVSSGGPISALLCHALGAPARSAIEMNLRIRNASVSELIAGARRAHVVSFNGIAHLELAGESRLVTFA